MAVGKVRRNPFKGELATGQLEDALRSVLVRLSDDSPEDGEAGAISSTGTSK